MKLLPLDELVTMRYVPVNLGELEKVENALSDKHEMNDIVTRHFGIPLSYKQLWTLRPDSWLVNDVSNAIIVIHTLLSYIVI